MNNQCNQDENIVGKALYELMRICNEVDNKGSPDEVVIKQRNGGFLKAKL